MFKKDSLLKSVNIICKLICFILYFISIILIDDPVFILIISFLYFLFTHMRKYIGNISLFTTFLSIISIFFPHFLWITKLLLIILYVIILSFLVEVKDVKYLFEKTFYRFQNKYLTKYIITIIYFYGLMKKNWCKIDTVRKNYGLNSNKNYYFNLIKRVYRVSKEELGDIILYHRLRLYNSKKTRTYMDGIVWEKWDNTYLVLHIFFFALAFFIGR